MPGTPAHSWQMVSQGKSNTAVKGMLYAACVLADAAKRLIEEPEIIQKARREFEDETEGNSYVCPIPSQVKPNGNDGKI